MTTQELLEGFERNKRFFLDSIFKITMFSEEPDENNCRSIATGLKIMAEKGNRTAATIYAIITAYDCNCNTFATETALALLNKIDGFEEYKKTLDEDFSDIFCDEDMEYFSNLPALWLSEAISKTE